jgi:hypothetical protein
LTVYSFPELKCEGIDRGDTEMGSIRMKALLAGIALALIGVSCDFVEPVCACTPPYFGALVAGTVIDASGQPVPNASIYMVGTQPGRTFFAPEVAEEYMPKTGADGAFVAQVTGDQEDVPLELHAKVYLPDRSAAVQAGTAVFHMNRFGPDTVKVSIVLPP